MRYAFLPCFQCLIPDQLDGIRKRQPSGSSPKHMSEYLQLPDDYATRSSVPGKKRVSSRTEVYYLSNPLSKWLR